MNAFPSSTCQAGVWEKVGGDDVALNSLLRSCLSLNRSQLLGASICAVPLSQPIPVKNYFQNRLSGEINVFSRMSAYFCSEKKMATKEGNWPTSLLLVRSSQLLPPFLPFQPRKAGFEAGLKILLYFVATHEVVFAVVALLFGCLNFVRNAVFHRPYLKGAFQRIKK